MRISQWFATACVIAVGGGFAAVHAQDNPAQAAARAALMSKMSELDAQEPPTNPPAQAIIVTPSGVMPASPAAAPQTTLPPAAAAAQPVATPAPATPTPAAVPSTPAPTETTPPPTAMSAPARDSFGFTPIPPPSSPQLQIGMPSVAPPAVPPAVPPQTSPPPAKSAATKTPVPPPPAPVVQPPAPAPAPAQAANANWPGKSLGLNRLKRRRRPSRRNRKRNSRRCSSATWPTSSRRTNIRPNARKFSPNIEADFPRARRSAPAGFFIAN